MRQKIYEYIEGQRQLVLELQRELTAIPALNPESGGEGEQAVHADEQAAGLTSMYELTFVNQDGLVPHLSKLF